MHFVIYLTCDYDYTRFTHFVDRKSQFNRRIEYAIAEFDN